MKLLAPERVGDAKFAERFTREAQALAALNHPNIVTIHDFGQAGGFYFLLMEFVDGVNLRQLLRARKFTPEEALAIVPPLCDALQFAHERGIVHRDIKPENLLLDKAGRVKVADFGIARMIESEAGGASLGVSPETAAAQPHDATGVIGTPGYSAPEQKTDPRRVDSRADIYSLGVVFYEMLTGELPGKRIEPPSRKVQIDVRLDEIVLRALEKNPELRYQQVSEVKTMVETIAGSAGVPPAELRAAHDAATNKPTNKSSLVLVIEILFGITFTSPLAIKLVNLSALGFLGFLSFLVYAFPERHWCLGLSSFFGFFGLIGFAYMVEMARRRKPKLTAGAFPTDATPDRAPPANIQSAKAHFSRAAIVGACWTPLFFITFVFNFQSEYRGPLWGQLLLMVTLLPLGFAAPFCTTILGWLAVSQIRRSAGKLYGMWLAVFDGLLFPLLAIDFVFLTLGHLLAMIIFSAVYGGQFTMNDTAANQQVPLLVPTCVRLATLITLILDFFIIRRVWRAVNKPLKGSPTIPTTKDSSRRRLAHLPLFIASMSGVLGAVAFCLFPNPPIILVWSVLAAALLGIALGIPVRRNWFGKSAIAVGSINAAIWLAVALAVNSTPFQIHLRELAHLNQWPEKVITQTIQHEVGRQLREAGATYDDLQVSVAIKDSGWPSKVSYRGLQNFKGADGTIPDANGEFIMQYIGGGQWQGALAGTQFTVSVGSQDQIDLPFVNDLQVIGEWESVDFVVRASDFNPDKPNPAGDQLFLKGLTFLENGKMLQQQMTWTKGAVIDPGDKTVSHYEIREINGKSYMFFEWKSGDVTISGMKPCYYVLKKTSSTGALAAATNAFVFGPVIERVLPCDDSDPTDMLDLDSGKIVKSISSDPIAPSTAAGIFYSQPASQLIASPSAVFQPIPGDNWESLTAQAVIVVTGKLAFTPKGRREYVPVDQLSQQDIFGATSPMFKADTGFLIIHPHIMSCGIPKA